MGFGGFEERGNGEQTRVEVKTRFKRGKSEIPASRMEIEESRREREERSEATDAVSEERDCDCACDCIVDILLHGK